MAILLCDMPSSAASCIGGSPVRCTVLDTGLW